MSVEVIVFTALGLETSAVRRHLRDVKDRKSGGNWLQVGVMQDGTSVAVCEVGPGNAAAAAAAAAVLTSERPSIAAFVGVAGGVKDVKLGDVVVATKVYGYESGKDKDSGFLPRPDVQRTDHVFEQGARAIRQRSDWHALLDPALWKDELPSVLVEPIAAGEKVVASNKRGTATFLKANYSDAVAVEMEGRGFLEAVHVAGTVQGVVVRGISDLLAKKTLSDGQNWQPKAADAAASLLLAMLLRHFEAMRGERGDNGVASGTIPEFLDHRILSGTEDLLQTIIKAVQRGAPSCYPHLIECVRIAKNACALADRAVERATAARAAGTFPPFAEIEFEKKRPRMFELAEGLGACIWDSADEFIGEFAKRRPSGLGVYKIYQGSHETTPDEINIFKGQVLSEKELGPTGTYEFASGNLFAGSWHRSRPHTGYKSSSSASAPFTFYFGNIRPTADNFWVEEGQGIGISMELREITCGRFENGRASCDCVDISFDAGVQATKTTQKSKRARARPPAT